MDSNANQIVFQVRGTIFNDLDDDKLHKVIDFSDFEDKFKIGLNGPIQSGNSETDGLSSFPSKRFKKPENVTLLEHTRLRNIGNLIYSMILCVVLSISRLVTISL